MGQTLQGRPPPCNAETEPMTVPTKADPATMRQATLADADAILALTRAAYAKWVPVIGREPLPMTADYAAAARHHRIDLLEIGGDIAALIETIAAADHLLVENLAVAPHRQGQGIGRRLLGEADRLAEASGLYEVRLYTNALFASNVAFYLGQGYRVTSEDAFRGGTVVHLAKRLGGRA